jgi:hypothetical protein
MRCCCSARLPSPKNVPGGEYANDRFFALSGDDTEFDFAFLDVKNRVRWVSLQKNGLVLLVVNDRPSFTNLAQKKFGIELRTAFGFHVSVVNCKSKFRIWP